MPEFSIPSYAPPSLPAAPRPANNIVPFPRSATPGGMPIEEAAPGAARPGNGPAPSAANRTQSGIPDSIRNMPPDPGDLIKYEFRPIPGIEHNPFQPFPDAPTPKIFEDLLDKLIPPGSPLNRRDPPLPETPKPPYPNPEPTPKPPRLPDGLGNQYQDYQIDIGFKEKGSVDAGKPGGYSVNTNQRQQFVLPGPIRSFGVRRSGGNQYFYAVVTNRSTNEVYQYNIWVHGDRTAAPGQWQGTTTYPIYDLKPIGSPNRLPSPTPIDFPDEAIIMVPRPSLYPSRRPSDPLPKEPEPQKTPVPSRITPKPAWPYPDAPTPSRNPTPNRLPAPGPNQSPFPSPQPRQFPNPNRDPTQDPAQNRSPSPAPMPSPVPQPSPETLPAPLNPPDPPCPERCTVTCRYQKPDLCNEPCIKEIQDRLNLLDSLQDILDLLNQQQQPEEPEPPQLQTINVPIVTCQDGQAVTATQAIQVWPEDAAYVLAQFQQLAAIKAAQCAVESDKIERVYKILGGDQWFSSGDGTIAKLKQNFEQPLRESTAGKINPDAPGYGEGHEVNSLPQYVQQLAAVLYSRLGLDNYPDKVPQSLLGYYDGQPPATELRSLSDYVNWILLQVDALVGKFPIQIEVEDSDPTQPGNQTRQIELPNISEALAELFGLSLTSSTNSDISINFLMRLASEVIATKNSSLITQDYAKANAAFLGYKGNPKKRDIPYSFDPTQLNSLERLLKESTASIVGWEEDDPESVVEYLKKLAFSAGIIKAAFFKNSKQMNQLQREIENMISNDSTVDEQAWNDLLDLLNGETAFFNKGFNPRPKVRNVADAELNSGSGGDTTGNTGSNGGT